MLIRSCAGLCAALTFVSWGLFVVAADDVLPGTQKLELTEPLDVVMVRGISEFAEQEIALSRDRREAHWNRDYSSPEAYEKSIAPNRERLRTYIGAVDERVQNAPVWFDSFASLTGRPQAQLEVLDGVTCRGVWNGATTNKAVIYVPDAAYDPEMLFGYHPGLPPHEQIARRLHDEFDIGVFIPTLINRSDEFSGNAAVRFTNQPHREFVYRGSFEMGRHIVGYEVQKILAMVDSLIAMRQMEKVLPEHQKWFPITVWGHGEGGLLAMMAAAIDPRIDVCIVSGYFQEREGVWQEPIYRNVWRQLAEFGDAEIASLIAPRSLVIEACSVPEVAGPPAVRSGRAGGAAPGKVRTAAIDSVEREFARAKSHYEKLGEPDSILLLKSGDGTGPVGSDRLFELLRRSMKTEKTKSEPEEIKTDDDLPMRIAARQKQQIGELTRHTQRLMHLSDKARDKYWAGADRSSLAKWEETQEAYRTKVYDELIGRIPYDLLPPNARSRKIIDEPTHTGYEVVLDVWEKGSIQPSAISNQPVDTKDQGLGTKDLPSVIAGGILLLPKDLKPGEKRPVVVCQHGLEGVPMDTITEDPKSSGYPPYKGFSSALVKRGFIVYAPQNPYRGHDDFRVIQRKSNPLGRSLFSYIIPQHQQTLNWLASLPYVDRDRIAFYGLSYGGKTAVRVPPMLVGGRETREEGREPNPAPSSSGSNLSSLTSRPSPGYCLSICSADFNEWVMKNTSYEDRFSYVFTPEYEIFEWNMGHVANYAELSNLMTPRPFMVERGHDDGVAPDEWVAWEYAKVKRHYDKLGIGDRTEMEVFIGPHTINGVGTYKFLHKHLNWPEPK